MARGISKANGFMPHDSVSQQILQSRLRQFQQPVAVLDAVDINERHLLRFAVGAQEYAVEYGDLIGVMDNASITPLPGCGPQIVGVLSYLGELLAVIDFQYLAQGALWQATENSAILVVQVAEDRFALAVPELRGEVVVWQRELSPLSPSARSFDFVDGIWRKTIMKLNLEKLLTDKSVLVAQE